MLTSNLWTIFFFVVASSILLVKSVDWMISSSTHLARSLRVSEYVIGAFLIAAASCIPELVFGVTSALTRNSSLSFGNVIGSNIADLTIIVALPILVGGAISTRDVVRHKDLLYAGIFGLIPVLLFLDNKISRIDGLILILCYLLNVLFIVERGRNSLVEVKKAHGKWVKQLGIFILSVVLILISGNALVSYAVDLSRITGIPELFIGLTIVAMGTSIPELIFGLKMVKTRHRSEILSSVLGSIVINSTFVLGITALIQPIQRDSRVGNSSIVFLVITLAFFFYLSWTGKKISRVEAGILLVIYIAFLITEKFIAGV